MVFVSSGFDAQVSSPAVTRFAPSPTGFLHLGHVASALYVWGLGRALGAKILLRMEDHDRSRSHLAYERAIAEDLAWLGFLPDNEAFTDELRSPSDFRQSDCEQYYVEALSRLRTKALVYACDCSRKAIGEEMQAQGYDDNEELLYLGHCRNRAVTERVGDTGLRLVLPDQTLSFVDGFLGPLTQTPLEQCGDLLLKDKNGQWTYQFAVVVDDLRHGVNLVIRGQDLTSSTGRQILLGQMLTGAKPSVYFHHPLIDNGQGQKLSKRFFADAVAKRRQAGEAPEKLLGEAAYHVGLTSRASPLSLDEVIGHFHDTLAKARTHE